MNSWRKPVAWLAFTVAVAGTPCLALAGSYDGSRPFLCAVSAITECNALGQCERQVADGVNNPAFIRVDVGSQTVTGANKTSSVKSATHLDGELMLQGGENARSWSITIDEETGRLAAAVVDNDHTFSIFANCLIP